MRILVSLGGNALLEHGEPPDAASQERHIRLAVAAVAPLAQDNQLVVTNGNGPQVGLLALEGAKDPAVQRRHHRDDQRRIPMSEIRGGGRACAMAAGKPSPTAGRRPCCLLGLRAGTAQRGARPLRPVGATGTAGQSSRSGRLLGLDLPQPPERKTMSFRSVIVGVDGSDVSWRALAMAAQLAKRDDGDVHACFVRRSHGSILLTAEVREAPLPRRTTRVRTNWAKRWLKGC